MSLAVNTWNSLLEKDEIRLLVLQPGSGSDVIKCNFRHARRSEQPLPLKIDGEIHHIRENLWLALWHLRYADTTRILWADALCINQRDNEERTHQVTQMGAIYSHASTVCVWLGLSDASSETAFDFLQQASTQKDIQARFIKYPGHWEDVERLCQRPYWERLWVMQEVILAKRILIHCGNTTFPWELLSRTLLAFKRPKMFARHETADEMRFTDELPYTQVMRSGMAARLMEERQERLIRIEMPYHLDRYGPSILSLVNSYQHGKCTDVRDKIYALHSFAAPCCRNAITVDYNCSAYVLCGRLLQHHCNCHYLGNGHRDEIVGISQNLHELVMGGELQQRGSVNSFPAGGPDVVEPHAITSLQGPILELTGRVQDIVLSVTSPLRTLFPIKETSPWYHRSKSPKAVTQISEDIPPMIAALKLNTTLDIILHIFEKDRRPCASFQRDRTEIPGPEIPPHFSHWFEFLEQISDALKHQPSANNCVLFTGYNGSVGFAAVGTEIGDRICGFRSGNVEAIIRKDPKTKTERIVSRCYTIRPAGYPFSEFSYHTNESLNASIDIPGLQILTRPSAWGLEDDQIVKV